MSEPLQRDTPLGNGVNIQARSRGELMLRRKSRWTYTKPRVGVNLCQDESRGELYRARVWFYVNDNSTTNPYPTVIFKKIQAKRIVLLMLMSYYRFSLCSISITGGAAINVSCLRATRYSIPRSITFLMLIFNHSFIYSMHLFVCVAVAARRGVCSRFSSYHHSLAMLWHCFGWYGRHAYQHSFVVSISCGNW